MCGMLAGADMTRRLFFVIDSMVLTTNAIGTDQMKDDAKRRWWQAQMIEELNRLVVDLKHRWGRHDNCNTCHPGKRDQRCTVQRKKEGEKKRKKSDRSSKAHKVQVGTASLTWWNLKILHNWFGPCRM